MSDEEFLARWSRRKREAKVAADAPAPAQTAETPNPASPVTAEDPANAEVDLSSLPPIDSITAATDVTAFLRQGIPQDLSRAALRRAWAADPAIRDFVGLAENAWDFNDPHAMPRTPAHRLIQIMSRCWSPVHQKRSPTSVPPRRFRRTNCPQFLLQCNRKLLRALRAIKPHLGVAHTEAHCPARLSTKGYSLRLCRFN